jgi:hypothetical protein
MTFFENLMGKKSMLYTLSEWNTSLKHLGFESRQISNRVFCVSSTDGGELPPNTNVALSCRHA